jgi:uncharacterized membrane-anchored protein
MKKITVMLFVLLCFIQLAVPSKMIFDKEEVLTKGHEYRFRTEPVDPYDPFRGKYVTLRFEAQNYTTDKENDWQRGETVFVELTTDSAGFAIIRALHRQEPQGDKDYVVAKITYAYGHDVSIEYPFTRFYMEETKAPVAEQQYNNANRSFEKEAYAVVYVSNGASALKDVMIDGVSLQVLAAQPAK